jgi:alpha-ketoglutaric semialdehyde dehydrogenase
MLVITGQMLIGSERVMGPVGSFRAFNPRDGAALEPAFGEGGQHEADRAAELAHAAFDIFRRTSPDVRADLLECIAQRIEELGDELIDRAVAETGLLRARLESERSRTTGQLRLVARFLRSGWAAGVRIDPAEPDRLPLPRPDLRQQLIGIGPVVVFGSSNFPLAFSNAGGDTASALAAGCPVIVKVHSAHPGTAMLVAGAVAEAVRYVGLPEGVYSSLIGPGETLGTALVAHPRIKAVGFTGSRRGGLALVRVAQSRPEPIPVYAEMSSTNPVYVYTSKATAETAEAFVASLTLGSGQFCTNPGLAFVPTGAEGDSFVATVAHKVSSAQGQTMLTPGICRAFHDGVTALREIDGVSVVAVGTAGTDGNAPAPAVFTVDADRLHTDERLQGEVFGAAALIVRYRSESDLPRLAELLDGQLTATVHGETSDASAIRPLLTVLERKVGRIVYNGWPTGVEVSTAMVHGGPYPSTSDARMTSVGTLAITRFQRPVAYQNLPDELLPDAVSPTNPWSQVQMVDGNLPVHV